MTAPGISPDRAGERARKVARWIASAAVLGACGYYLATRTDREALARALRHTDYRLVLAMTIGHLVVVLPIKAWRWQRVLAPVQMLPLSRLYAYCLAGCAVSNLVPARAGHGSSSSTTGPAGCSSPPPTAPRTRK